MSEHDDAVAAARAAEATYDWSDAIRLYEEALSSLPREDDAWPAVEAELLTALGRSYWRNAEARPAWRTLMRAITSCKQRGDAAAQARATLEILKIWGPWERHKMMAEDALAALGGSEPYLRARLLWASDRGDEAFALAEQHGYDDVLAFRVSEQGWRASREGRLDEARAIAQEMHAAHDGLGNWEAAASGLRGIGFSTLLAGDLDLGEPILRQSCEYAAKYHLRFFEQLALMDVIGVGYARGEWDECERMLDSIVGGADFRADLFRMWIAELSGDVERAKSLLVDPQRAGGSGDGLAQVHSARAGVLYRAGQHGAARAELEVMLRSANGEHQNLEHYVPACIDAIVALCDDDTIRACVSDMQPSDDPHRRFDSGFVYSTLQGRALHYSRGALALRLGRDDEAAGHFAEGVAWADRERCPLDAAACHEGLAQVAARRGDAEAADRESGLARELRAAHLPPA
jgi:tetratricopeptide (TPR) repeat protein